MRTVTPRSRRAWRSWLGRYHAAAGEVWVVFYKRHTGKPTVTYEEAVEEALCFGWIDGVKKAVDAERYMHRFSPRLPASRWSESNRRRVAQLSASGLMTAAGQALVDAAKANGSWAAPAANAIDVTMPAEFAQALDSNREAKRFFASLAPSYQRQYMAWIATAKRADTRARRLSESIALLRQGRKLGMR